MMDKSYVLVTAARNEEAFIEKTIQSVICQSVLPQKWVIVSDGSTDRTDEIVRKYTVKYDFIQLVCVRTCSNRNFASKVNAINAGYKQVKNTEYDYLGILDADVSFEVSYYESVLAKFNQNIKLGIAGGIIIDVCDGKFNKKYTSPESVSGAIQLFRRQCYEQIGGYIPLEDGGVDAVAEVMARMKGWQTRAFSELKVFHYRRMGTKGRNIYSVRFRQGREDYLLGYHPLFELAKCLLRIKEKPYFVGSLLWIWGYYWPWLSKIKREIPDDIVRYLRQEQLRRLKLW
jgi:glycosyltransferase involved in cell wall biosynthesis